MKTSFPSYVVAEVPAPTSVAIQRIRDRPAVAAACDVILCNCYPFWEGTLLSHSFDEPWKGSPDPLEPEKHWGLFNVDRTPKAALRGRMGSQGPSNLILQRLTGNQRCL